MINNCQHPKIVIKMGPISGKAYCRICGIELSADNPTLVSYVVPR